MIAITLPSNKTKICQLRVASYPSLNLEAHQLYFVCYSVILGYISEL